MVRARADPADAAAADRGGSGACDGSLTLDWNAYNAQHPGALGNSFSAGRLVQAQAWIRDPASARPAVFSNAVEFTIVP